MRGKKLSEPKTQKQSEENISKSIRDFFILKTENEEVKDRIIRDTRTSISIIILNMKVTVTEIETYH